MAKQYPALDDTHCSFILRQKMFFTATADRDGRVNLSPKGLGTFRILDGNRVAWLDLTGSGNETSAHLEALPRITVMFCAFEEPPQILRLYGTGRVLRRGTAEYRDAIASFDELPGARQIVAMQVELVQTSCGYAVPLYDYRGDRATLISWAESKGEAGVESYRQEKNRTSMDGRPTGWPAA